MAFTIQENSDGLIFKARIQPRSSRNQVAGLYGDVLKINLTAPPVDNAANKACCAFLADLLSVPKSSVRIVSGHTARTKQIMIRCPGDGSDRRGMKKAILGWVAQRG